MLAAVGAGAVAVVLIYLFLGLRGDVSFVLGLRFSQLAGLCQVGIAVAVSTVIFQTITANGIISPSIMGLDALYLFCQILLVFALGGLGFAALPPSWKFAGEAAVMMGLALLLFLPMLRQQSDMMLMILSGVVIGLLFRSLASFLARLVDPGDFAVAQGASFARFQSLEPQLLALGALVTTVGGAIAWRARHMLDVIALGRDSAIALGLDWNRNVTALLLLVAVLVGASTALVGPLAFLGLLVVAIAERLTGTRRHAILLPAASGIAVIVLVGAQTIGRSTYGGGGVISIIVEFVGGIAFLMLLFGRVRA